MGGAFSSPLQFGQQDRSLEEGNRKVPGTGRTDAVYGEIYFNLPTGTRFFQTQPPANLIAPTAAALYTTTAPMVVGIRYGNGDGAQPGAGNIRSYQGSAEIGTPLIEADAEYDLLKRATAIAAAFNGAIVKSGVRGEI